MNASTLPVLSCSPRLSQAVTPVIAMKATIATVDRNGWRRPARKTAMLTTDSATTTPMNHRL